MSLSPLSSSGSLSVLDRTSQNQRRAADPRASAWVAANAGSGKTHVLTMRVVRLLLDGTPPDKILCLTYTKAAAAEMSLRVFNRLASWTLLSDAELEHTLQGDFGLGRFDHKQMRRARQLFAAALETPGGLKIQTIHSFCERILHQFPFEADVPSQFSVLSEDQSAQMLSDARDNIFVKHTEQGSAALAALLEAVADQTLIDALNGAIDKRVSLMRWIDQTGGLQGAMCQLRQALGLEPSDELQKLEHEICSLGLSRDKEFRAALYSALLSGSKNPQKHAKLLEKWPLKNADIIARLQDFYMTSSDVSKPRVLDKLFTKALCQTFPHLLEQMQTEQVELSGLLEKRRACQLFELNQSFFAIALDIFKIYAEQKRCAGMQDFNDQIDAVERLLTQNHAAADWVHYKLDGGIDHILIDEAQDTSPSQWRIISALSDEFFAGDGAAYRDPRTLFAVGDEKQSIYSFQGAIPEGFRQQRRAFQARVVAAGQRFEDVPLDASFRSLPGILDVVDRVFNAVDGQRNAVDGVTDQGNVLHQSAVPDLKRKPEEELQAHMEIWPLVDVEKPSLDPLDPNFHEMPGQSSSAVLAQQIAQTIYGWLRNNKRLYSMDRPIKPADILVLVRSRGPFVSQLIRALKRRNIPVAGADRLKVQAHIVAQDLLALASVMLFPADDLSLAAVLKSPLFDFDDDDLIALAAKRKGTLWSSLFHHQDMDLRFQKAFETLSRWQARVDFDKPFDFFARILGAEGGRRAFVASLGEEANDVLDAFLDRALGFELDNTPTFQHFVSVMTAQTASLKRDLDAAQNEVRIMTVHGAKGLEAPIVFLADAASQPRANRIDPILPLNASGHSSQGWIWSVGKSYRAPLASQAIEYAVARQRQEYNRLLYVAMTRASDALFVCGLGQQKDTAPHGPVGSWYHLISSALKPNDAAQHTPFIALGQESGFPRMDLSAQKQRELLPALRSYDDLEASILAPAPAITQRLKRIRPSEAWSDLVDTIEEAKTINQYAGWETVGELADPARWDPRQRGTAVHHLLQMLPPLPEQERMSAGLAYLAAQYPELTNLLHQELAQMVISLISAPQFSDLFGPDSQAEVTIQGQLENEKGQILTISGQIDRLFVTEEEVIIVDFKTDRLIPETHQIAKDYLTQLGLYKQLVANIYPSRSIRAGLLWTQGPKLAFPDDALLDSAAQIALSA